MTLARELIAQIEKSGPLTLAEYMARANAYYYATHEPFGAMGDFITAPEISQIFGEVIGAWLADRWRLAGKHPVILCEPGPGRGTLMKDIMRATSGVAGFHEAISIRLIETSPRLREVQQKSLLNTHPRITWHTGFDDLPALPLLLVANEFFDALPIHHYVKTGLKETERKVGYDGKGFIWSPEGAVIGETSPASIVIMTQIASHIRKFGGDALILDYGYAGGIQRDTLQAVHHHAYCSPLANPGEADLTAHVDFGALMHAAQQSGTQSWGIVEQGVFLKRLGAELRATALCKSAAPAQREALLSGLERLVAPHAMGTLFKVMAVTSALDRPAGF